MAGRLVEAPIGGRPAARRRQLEAEEDPEAQAPFGQPQGPPLAADDEILDLAIAPRDLAAGMRQVELDGRAGEVVAQQLDPVADLESGEGRPARGIGARGQRKTKRREGNLRRMLSVPAVPGALERDHRFGHGRTLMRYREEVQRDRIDATDRSWICSSRRGTSRSSTA